MTVYRVFDIAIACGFPLTGLPVLQRQTPSWRVDTATGTIPEHAIEWIHHWTTAQGDEVMACARHGYKYLLRFSGLASFSIDFEQRQISVFAETACPEYTLAHLLIDQVIPRVLGHMGRVALHASAVELADGQAIAFTGVSGRGKSTLATAFFRAGYRLLSDDCLLLEKRDGTMYAMASYASLRLWADSAQAVGEEEKARGGRYTEMAHYSKKRQLLFDQAHAPTVPRWVKLNRLYILEDSPAGVDSSLVWISPVGGMASTMALIGSSFTLDVVSETSIRRGFDTVQQVAGGVTVKRLAYPRNYGALPEVIAAVRQDQHP